MKYFQKISFIYINANACIFIIKQERKLIIIGIYINNLVIRLKNLKALEWLKDQLIKKFNMKNLGKTKKIIG